MATTPCSDVRHSLELTTLLQRSELTLCAFIGQAFLIRTSVSLLGSTKGVLTLIQIVLCLPQFERVILCIEVETLLVRGQLLALLIQLEQITCLALGLE